ncbi:peptide-methionine (S)-S-oxide reductase MsrA [Saccharibacillus qingshengii]|uniref:peptide-methionine (S)-S-oxide reductase MsrA n=1 Tax=Saccharibacillus qingshengii TaxID=1763540 RepID=UPI001553270F|nr:peptide-methionine (S)-S-oxide reductase MsrA [Saccharibacillus qingshengii]
MRKFWISAAAAALAVLLLYSALSLNGEAQSLPDPDSPAAFANPNDGIDYSGAKLHTIYLAGGCFWGVEAYLSRVYGVSDVTVGYAYGGGSGGGSGNADRKSENPAAHSEGSRESAPPDTPPSGYAETARVAYDPARISLEELLSFFFRVIDPTTLNRQGEDVGTQYRSGVYYTDEADWTAVEAAIRRERSRYNQPIVTEALPLGRFVAAAESQQDYLDKHPSGYCSIDLHALDE